MPPGMLAPAPTGMVRRGSARRSAPLGRGWIRSLDAVRSVIYGWCNPYRAWDREMRRRVRRSQRQLEQRTRRRGSRTTRVHRHESRTGRHRRRRRTGGGYEMRRRRRRKAPSGHAGQVSGQLWVPSGSSSQTYCRSASSSAVIPSRAWPGSSCSCQVRTAVSRMSHRRCVPR